jgi:protein ImuB
MSRIVSVWLPRWPILRFLAAQARRPPQDLIVQDPIAPEQPFVLTVTTSGGPRVAVVNAAAEAAGLAPGEPLADARAKAGFLQVRAVDPAADDAALQRLTLWATRYTPTASPWNEENGADGFFLDIEGAAHLFGGEEALLADLARRLSDNFGLPARLAVAATPGAAWALARFHPASCPILPTGQEAAAAAALARLPVEALRLTAPTCATLRRLGFKKVGTLFDKPRAPFAARFSAELIRRLDQALGRVEEPLVPIVPPPVYHSLRYLIDPIFTQEAVVALARRLMQNLVHVLTRDDVGARALKLSLYRVDGEVKTLDLALTLPTRSVPHVARMIELKLEALAAAQDAGFGFEAVGLAVTRAESMPARQTELDVDHHLEDDERAERHAALIDALRQRLGPHRVRHFAPVESHLPERAEVLTTDPSPDRITRSDPLLSGEGEQKLRPLLLFPHAEPTEVTALIPDGPPRRFRWRGVTYDVAGAQGPERIANEWWRRPLPLPSPQAGEGLTRDYYLVEDAHGHRFWLFREGLYGRETAAARWFVHGIFA